MTKDEAIEAEAERQMRADYAKWKAGNNVLGSDSLPLRLFSAGWLAAKRAIEAPPTSEAVATVSGSSVRWLPAASKLRDGTELFATQPAADPAPVPAQTSRTKPKYDEAEFQRMVVAGTKAWAGVPDNWLDEQRGNLDHAKRAEGERAAFEAWKARGLDERVARGLLMKNESGSYQVLCIEQDWTVWQARGQQAGVPEGFALVPVAANADEIVTRLYRRFKDWSKRGFGPDDVTWCEVKADVLALLAAAPGEAG